MSRGQSNYQFLSAAGDGGDSVKLCETHICVSTWFLSNILMSKKKQPSFNTTQVNSTIGAWAAP